MSYRLRHGDPDGGWNYLRYPIDAVLAELVSLGIPQHYERGPVCTFDSYEDAWECAAVLDAMGITGWRVEDPFGMVVEEPYLTPDDLMRNHHDGPKQPLSGR